MSNHKRTAIRKEQLPKYLVDAKMQVFDEPLEMLENLDDDIHALHATLSKCIARLFLLHFDEEFLSKFDVDNLNMLLQFLSFRKEFVDEVRKYVPNHN